MSNYRQLLGEAVCLAESQGWRVEQDKKVTFYPADRAYPPVVAHFTPSDHRALKNLRSMLRRAGLEGL